MSPPALRAIVITDDDADDRFIFRRLLQRVGVLNPVHVCVDGEELLAFLRSCQGDAADGQLPCLVFLDIKMPRLNGFEVLRSVRGEGAFSELPIIILSGSDEPKDRKRARELGATNYLTKHPTEKELAAVLAGFPHVRRVE